MQILHPLICMCVTVIYIAVKVNSDESGQPTRMTILNEQQCVHEGETITLTCILNIMNKYNKQLSLEWSWRSIYRTHKINHTIESQNLNGTSLSSKLTIYTDWTGDRLFTCVARSSITGRDSKEIFRSSSVVKVASSQKCEILGIRALEAKNFDRIEIYWRPANNSQHSMQFVNICDEKKCWQTHKKYEKCYNSIKEVYGVPKSKGFVCMSYMSLITDPPGEFHVNYKVFIGIRENEDACERKCSREKRFIASYYDDEDPGSKFEQVILLPMPVEQLVVKPIKERKVSSAHSSQNMHARIITKFVLYNKLVIEWV